MADLSRNRGQIILVAAFALAVIFLTLALVVNSAIFTENLASRSDTTGSDGALSNRAAVERNVGEAMRATNREHTTNLNSELEDNIRSFNSQTGQQQALSGQLVEVTYDPSDGSATTEGDQIDYDDGRFNDTAGNNYRLATHVDPVSDGNGTRAFLINASTLPGSSDPRFTVTVSDGTADWETEIWNDGGTIRVSTTRSGFTASESCGVSASGATTRIDLTGGMINGEPCSALGTNETGAHYHFGAGVTNTYSIEFSNANQIAGDLTVVLHPEASNTYETPGGVSPENALYDVTVEYSYTTNDVHYVTDIRVAPGEPDA